MTTATDEKQTDDKPSFNPFEAIAQVINLLAAIARSVARRPRPFREICAANSRCGSQMTAGILRSVHNPTSAALQVTLSDGTNAAVVVYNGLLAAGSSAPVYMAFYDGLYCSAGSGAVVGGTFNA